ncbi:hypothetical protein LPJ73_009189, partial [Coemansia sp. RSA 2703]
MAPPAADASDPDLLLRVHFGPALARRTRRKIERYIARALSPRTHSSPARKRRRYASSSSEDISSENESDCGPAGLSLTYYDTGFLLDTTADASTPVSYTRATHTVLGFGDAQNTCFNCSLPGHTLRACPMPPDAARIDANRA